MRACAGDHTGGAGKIVVLADALETPDALFQEPHVFVMRADPKPRKEIALAGGQSAKGTTDPNRPERVNLFEPKRRMVRVFKEQLVLLDCLALNLNRESIETSPKTRCSR